jgi:hypothetical protein
VRDCFIVSRNASPGQRRWECLNMRMLADPVLGWEGGMRPVNKFVYRNLLSRAGCPGMWILTVFRFCLGLRG